MADIEEKIDVISGMVHEFRPMLISLVDGQKAMDVRVRAIEVTSAEHGVKIDRLQADTDGLGRKVRHLGVAEVVAKKEGGGGRWLAFLELLAVLPQYVHVLIAVGSIAIAAVAVAVGRTGHK